MTFISYAKSYEDEVLWRALKHVNEGFYIDVGANDPNKDSITKVFYDSGWSGINIEPVRAHHRDLSIARARDTNLLMVAGSKHGQIELWICEVCGRATASKEAVSSHQAIGHKGYFCRAPVAPLKDICAQYVKSEIHFLKIDVEGLEAEVIKGMDLQKYRPWILVIEATKPNPTDEVHCLWEASILSSGYQLAYADGLNRFYLATEKLDLLNEFRCSPYVFDSHIRVQQLESEAEQEEVRAEQTGALKNEKHMQPAAIHNSRSWRITTALRWPVHQWRLIQHHGFAARAKALIKGGLAKVALFVYARPALKSICINVAHRLGIAHRLIQFTPKSQSQKKISSFKDLRSVQIMAALSNLSKKNGGGVVTFLDIDNER